MAFVLHLAIVISCLLELLFTYFLLIIISLNNFLLLTDYLFQRLHKFRSYSLKEHEAVFLTRQSLIFYIVAGKFDLIFV